MIRTIASALAAFALVSFAAHAETAKVEDKEAKKEVAVEAKADKKAEKAEKKHGHKKAAEAPKADAAK